MALTRSQRIFLLSQQRAEQIEDALISPIPPYESTRGSTSFQQVLAIRGWQLLEEKNNLEAITKSLETKIQILEGTKSRPIIKKNVKDDTSKGNLPDNNTDLHENYYDSFSEDKTSGSEYIPSTDEDSSYNFPVTKKFKKRSKKLPKQIDKKCDNVSTTENILDTDQPSGYKPDSMQEIHISDSEQENIVTPGRQAEFLEPSSNIKIISNILLKLPTNSNTGHINEGVSAIVLAEGITESSNITSSNDNFVQISAAKHSTEGKRIRDKKHSCYYCHNLILHIGRHLEVKHANELDVARALAFPKKSDKRKELLSVITKAGDFHHNCEVLSLKQGHLILVRRPTKNEIRFNKYRDYGPCPNCLGFLLKKHLWLHLKTKCSKKDPNDQEQDLEQANKQVIAESNAILNCVFGTEFSDVYISNIVNTLRDDDIGTCCKEDTLILRFGCMLFEKYGTTQSELIRQSMRQLARLTLAINEMTIQNLKLFDLLAPQKFDLVIQGVKELCRRHQNDVTKRPEFMTPSLALKLGYSLKKCANIERGLALRQENLRRNESLLAFCNLMELEWQIRISSNALSSLFKRKLNAGQLLPVTSDLLKCNTHIRTELEKAQTALIKCSTAENWSRLAKLILCRIILFNKRRAGEASKMTLEQYSSRPSWSQQTTEELKTSLTPYELKLAERHVIVNIIGKRGRFVPVLLTQETKTGIDVLISHRGANVGIHPENPYIFARGLQTLTPLRGPDVLRKIVSEIEELEKPNLITSTKLRKYIATVCQVFSLSENEYDWLARHLGHDIRVHREFYRLHEDVVELTKVSRLLMAVDNGEASKFAGMPLKDIKLAELPPIDEEAEDNQEIDDDLHENAQMKDNDYQILSEVTGNMNIDQTQKESRTKTVKQANSKGKKRVTKSSQWDINDKKAVLQYFKVNIKKGIVPGKADCESCQEANPHLKNRKWSDLKFCVKNQITKIKNIKKD